MKMKRRLLAITAAMVSFLLVGITVAQAVDFKFSGQIRPRWEVNEQNDFDQFTNEQIFVSTRVRFNVLATISENISAFIQLQSWGFWGDAEVQGNAGNRSAPPPSDNLNDVGFHQAYFIIKNLFTVSGLSTQIGRQEITLDGHRLIGNTGWTQGAQTHDAARLTFSQNNFTLLYVFSKVLEQGSFVAPEGTTAASRTSIFTGPSFSDDKDIDAHIVYASLKGILGGQLSFTFVGLVDDSFDLDRTAARGGTPVLPGICPFGLGAGGGPPVTGECNEVDNDIYTAGIRQAGQLFGIDYRGEFYYQWGDAEGVAPNNMYNGFGGLVTASNAAPNGLGNGTGSDIDRSAYMFGFRVGKKFNNVMWKPSFTVWYDQLSGTDDEDIEDNDWGTFDTLFDTGHKFYGFMDLFLPSTGANTAYMGLRDLAFKMSVEPTSKLKIKVDLHIFWTDTDLGCDNVAAIAGTVAAFTTTRCAGSDNPLLSAGITGGTIGAMGIPAFGGAVGDLTPDDYGTHLGEELDLTIVYKYAPSTTFTIGYSHFWTDNLFHLLNPLGGGIIMGNSRGPLAAPASLGTGRSSLGSRDNASWAYVQADVRF